MMVGQQAHLMCQTYILQRSRARSFRDKEQLAEGLHLIDFEQLKIENQSLNEKIEERNEELIKLRKKTTITVQVRPHCIMHNTQSLLILHMQEPMLGAHAHCNVLGLKG